MGEFDLIKQYFTRSNLDRADVVLAVGDDCAVTTIESHQQLVITTDTLVCGTHFLADIDPYDLGYKSVAVNLSDVASMGAKPTWVSLALTLPSVNEIWLTEFSRGLFEILDRYNVSLIGGDTTKGHLSITLTAQGILNKDSGLFRHKAKEGDFIFVSGTLGDSAAGLALLLNRPQNDYSVSQHNLLQRHLRPTPRVELGQALIGYSNCAIDISDGLLADLGHILKRSQVGATIELDKLPLSQNLIENYSLEQAETFALSGGEDYELCFTAAKEQREAMERALAKQGIAVICIGQVTEQTQGLVLTRNGEKVELPTRAGFNHFG
ncbi:thiamine-phosphate kinase [Pasteurellaceae bacterium 15-036681]|nr:thiamine-phosphate kinase [Pasteurellaceae bacterium 15-036681]